MDTHGYTRTGRLLVTLAFALSLMLPGASQAVLAKTPEGLEAVAPAAAPVPQEEVSGVEAAVDCADPSRPPGAYRIKLLQENEIAVTNGDDLGLYDASFLDYQSESLTHYLSKTPGSGDDWGTSTAVDFNGSGTRKILTVYRDTDRMLKATVVGTSYPVQHEWRAGLGRQQGANVGYIRVAAGNLQRRTDGRETAVIAFRNDDLDLEMIALDGGAQTDGGIGQLDGTALATFPPSVLNGRGDVSHVSVAAGDLDGNGVDDEIVTAFKDGHNHLQVMVTRLTDETGAWQFEEVSSLRYTDSTTAHYAYDVARYEDTKYGISVATGDVDGDGVDEAVLGFSDYEYMLQVLVLELANGVLTDSLRYLRMDRDVGDYGTNILYWLGAPSYVSVVTADYNADARAEIVLAYTTHGDVPVVIRPVECADSGCAQLVEKPFKFASGFGGEFNVEYHTAFYVTAAAGDIDRDGYVDVAVAHRGEVSTSFLKDDAWAWVHLFKYDPATSELKQVTRWMDNEGTTRNGAFTSVVMGDLNGDGSRLVYTGECKEYTKQVLNTVANLPPTWLGVTRAPNLISVEFGNTSTFAAGQGHTSSTSYGGTLTIDSSIAMSKIVETGPLFTTDFKNTQAVTNEKTEQTSTTLAHLSTFGADSSAGFAVSDLTTYHTYKYLEKPTGEPVFLRVPWKWTPQSDVMEQYYNATGREGWVPLGGAPNIALGKPASQSSTYLSGAAGRAVDGNTDGTYANGSVTHTGADAGPWWQVDLGSVQYISAVRVWNRTDCCADRLANWQIKLSDTGADWAAPKWASALQGQLGSPSTFVAVDKYARYVRVEMPGQTQHLSLAEVEVQGTPLHAGRMTNLALNKAATQKSTAGAAVAGRAVDGDTNGALAGASVATTNSETGSWWQVDLGSIQPIASVDVWNCTDATCKTRLQDWWVKISTNGDWDTAWVYPRPDMAYTTIAESPDPVTFIIAGERGRYVRIEIPNRTESLNLAEVQVWKARQVGDFPKAVTRDSSTNFTITRQDGSTQKVNGNLQWDWCTGYLDPPISVIGELDAIPQKVGNSQDTWASSTSTEKGYDFSDTWSLNETFAYEAKVMGAGISAGVSIGFEEGTSRSLTWGNGTYFNGKAGYIPSGFTAFDYEYCPYYYTVQQAAADGIEQSYMVLDYYVPWCQTAGCKPAMPSAAELAAAAPAVMGPFVPPQAPVIESPTHPDPGAWSAENDVTFTWSQPPGDAATIAGYRWYLDKQPGTVPEPPGQGNIQTTTFHKLPDGEWYLHVRAMSGDGQWSDTAHRRIRIDKNPPEVELTLDPPAPTGNQGWYRTPVTVTATATDAGAGVAALEISQDGTNWQAYGGPLDFSTDTPGATVWARATDSAGRASEPISTSFKIDMTPPNSHVQPECGSEGLCVAEIRTDDQGNQQVVLAGQLDADLSGWAGMQLRANAGSWFSASALGQWPLPDKPTVEANWYFTSTLDIPAGYFILMGGASDGAGNHEEPYRLGDLTWYPTSAPDMAGSALTVEPARVRPGDVVTVTLTLRNGGLQEAIIASETRLPDGISPVEASLASLGGGITHEPGSNFILWPQRLVWPGTSVAMSFRARVGEGVGAGTLALNATGRAFWPNSNLLLDEERQRFEQFERSIAMQAQLEVEPGLPPDRDLLAPRARLIVLGGEVANRGQVELGVEAGEDVSWMYLREWTLDPSSGDWVVAQNSGWRGYSPTVTWSLSSGGGVKYLGVWVKDRAGNVSQLDELSLAFTNRPANQEPLGGGQRHQYRFTVEPGAPAVFNVLADRGDPDLFVWKPRTGRYPQHSSMGAGLLEAVGLRSEMDGVYLVEVGANGDSAYTFLLATSASAAASPQIPARMEVDKTRPEHPLTVSDPLSAGQAGTPDPLAPRMYLPVISGG